MGRLTKATRNNNVSKLRKLLQGSHHHDPPQWQTSLQNALLAACELGYMEPAKCLIEEGNANVNQRKVEMNAKEDRRRQGKTPLEVACIYRHAALAAYLASRMEPGALKEAQQRLVADGGRYSEEALWFLAELFGAGLLLRDPNWLYNSLPLLESMILADLLDVNQLVLLSSHGFVHQGEQLVTPLHVACGLSAKHGLNMSEIVRLLLERNADPNARDEYLKTPLAYLCTGFHGGKRCFRTLTFLLQHGADPNMEDINGNTPLLTYLNAGPLPWYLESEIHSSLYGFHSFEQPAFCIALLDAGANINHCNHAGDSPLALAIGCNSLTLAQAFLHRGAMVPTKQGMYALELACNDSVRKPFYRKCQAKNLRGLDYYQAKSLRGLELTYHLVHACVPAISDVSRSW